MTWLEQFDRLPPFLCVALANKRRGITMRDLAARSGLPYSRVLRIAQALTWGRVTMVETEAFTRACGVDLSAQKLHLSYLRRTRQYRNPMRDLKWGARRLVMKHIA